MITATIVACSWSLLYCIEITPLAKMDFETTKDCIEAVERVKTMQPPPKYPVIMGRCKSRTKDK